MRYNPTARSELLPIPYLTGVVTHALNHFPAPDPNRSRQSLKHPRYLLECPPPDLAIECDLTSQIVIQAYEAI